MIKHESDYKKTLLSDLLQHEFRHRDVFPTLERVGSRACEEGERPATDHINLPAAGSSYAHVVWW